MVKATSEKKKKEHADKQTCLPVHGTIEFSRRAFRFFSNKRYRRVRAYIIPLSRYLGLCSPFIPTDPRNDESRRRSHCRVRCIETLITAVRGQGTVEKDRFLLFDRLSTDNENDEYSWRGNEKCRGKIESIGQASWRSGRGAIEKLRGAKFR